MTPASVSLVIEIWVVVTGIHPDGVICAVAGGSFLPKVFTFKGSAVLHLPTPTKICSPPFGSSLKRKVMALLSPETYLVVLPSIVNGAAPLLDQ